MAEDLYEYYCQKCKIKITHDAPGYVECPKCKSGKDVVDLGDYGEYDNVVMGNGSFNWNKP